MRHSHLSIPLRLDLAADSHVGCKAMTTETNETVDEQLSRLRQERQLIRDALSQQRLENATAVTFDGQTITRQSYELLVKDEARLTHMINDLIVRKRTGYGNYLFGRRIRV